MPQPILEKIYGTTEGKEVKQYTLTNLHGSRVSFINYGGAITELFVADRNGDLGNVVLGFESLHGYLQAGNPYIGALIGRFGNRIAEGKFTLDEVEYQLATNNMGNALHGGIKGFDKVYWDATTDAAGNAVSFFYRSADGEEGYPGTLEVTVQYELTDDNELNIRYTATTDKASPVNLTNHAYYNLSAGKDATIRDHHLTLNASRFTEVNGQLVPTGNLPDVSGGPMDFRSGKRIGQDIDQVPGGYDHNWVTEGEDGQFRHIATLWHKASGRMMQVYTTEPGVQFYSGNFLDGTLNDTRDGRAYVRHAGLCLETQHFPDSPNQPGFPSTILRPGEVYTQHTQYRFLIK